MQRIELRSDREGKPVKIVGDAAMATGSVSEGRLVPLLILEATARPEIVALIQAHATLQPGDVSSQWGQRKKGDETVVLILEFERPVVLTLVVEFEIVSQGVLVDLILKSRAFYLQAGKPGDRFITTQDHPRLFVEAPNTGFERLWHKIYLDGVTKELRRRGLNRKSAKTAAEGYLNQMRRMSSGRMRS